MITRCVDCGAEIETLRAKRPKLRCPDCLKNRQRDVLKVYRANRRRNENAVEKCDRRVGHVTEYGEMRVIGYTVAPNIMEDEYLDFEDRVLWRDSLEHSVKAGYIPPGIRLRAYNRTEYCVVGQYMQGCKLVEVSK